MIVSIRIKNKEKTKKIYRYVNNGKIIKEIRKKK